MAAGKPGDTDEGGTGQSDPQSHESDPPIRSTAALGALGRAILADTKLLGAKAGSAARRHAAQARQKAADADLGQRLRDLKLPEFRRPPASDKPARPRRRGSHRPLWRRIAGWFAMLAAAGVAAVIGLFAWALWDMDFSGIAEADAEPTVVIEALDGEMFASKGPFRGVPIDPSALPQPLTDAVIAIEDHRFRSHPGLDLVGIARATMVNLRAGGVVEGASTITMQLARTLFLSQDRTLKRKLRETALAVWLDATLSKDEILSRYMSNIYMGAGVWGMSAASQTYFGKDPDQLSLAEAAVLAGLIKAPSDLNPRSDLQAANERASVVLEAMLTNGVADEAAVMAARAQPAALHETTVSQRSGGWFADFIYDEASDLAGSFKGALYVRTTLHPRVQQIAEDAVAGVMDAEGEAANATQAALVAMLPDGAVLALVGGRDYEASQFNRATEALRQPGSTFKTFVFFAALRDGWSMRDRIRDEPIEIDGWQPENYSGRYRGRVRLEDALALSLNAATVRLAHEIGVDRVIDAARTLGIDAELSPTPSLALGTSEVTLIDLTGAYAALLEGRAPVDPWGIVNFGTDPDRRYRLGNRSEGQQALGPARAELIDALRLAVEEGTGKAARLDGFAAGKTGTTQDNRDAWFIGFNGPFVAGVWVGNDDNSPMDGVTGGGLPARIWRNFMTGLMQMLADGDSLLKPVGEWSAAEGDGALRNRDATAQGQALSCNIAACDRAYRSFRESDCTFQPYRGGRKRCTK